MPARLLAGAGALAGAALVARDLLQREHAILRNFPVVGHFRYLLEAVGPELRQYIVTSNDEERPFSRDQRRWVYASSKREINTFGFGTDNDLEQVDSLLVIKHTPFPQPAPREGAAGRGAGLRAARRRRCSAPRTAAAHAFRPASIVNISGDELRLAVAAPRSRRSTAARRCAGCLQNTGEGGLAPAHQHGGELIFQIGTGYFGCRDADGRFSLERLLERARRGARARDRDQALAGRQARARRAAARRRR